MKQFGLPKCCVLRKNGEFKRVYQAGRRLYGEGFAIIYLANNLPQSRLGISVQRKVGNAVRRNRIKRLVREVFRLHRAEFPQQADIIITVRPGITINTTADMYAAMGSVLLLSEKR
ncbi:ribonuclease P protein component [Desulfogranum japonicum]|uniref:ribonuclease P protein component n=1 Tax=Desulfogranum japonicum TaxID=231447 RepID=UPI000413B2EE|nr:ribonuclease P protein component [Desulfogranum japonicum]